MLFRYKEWKKKKHRLEERQAVFEYFNKKLIPHSKKIYTIDTISETNKIYDCFVAGSDQIWNLNWYVPTYYLDFVNKIHSKISYAASFGITNFTTEQKEKIKQHLKDYKMLSLREHSSLESEGVFPFDAKILADPTLLLNQEDWDKLACPRMEKDNYMFCYFFGDNQQSRSLAKEYAKLNHLKMVTIPHLNEENLLDVQFGDSQIEVCSPEMFLSLIKNSECVFTDSFHAVVFAYIFKKNFFVFERTKKDTMSSRIYSITELFNAKDRFCYNENQLDINYIQRVKPLNYDMENCRLNQLIKESEEYLINIRYI